MSHISVAGQGASRLSVRTTFFATISHADACEFVLYELDAFITNRLTAKPSTVLAMAACISELFSGTTFAFCSPLKRRTNSATRTGSLDSSFSFRSLGSPLKRQNCNQSWFPCSRPGSLAPSDSMATAQNSSTNKKNGFCPCFHLPGFQPFWGFPIFDNQPYAPKPPPLEEDLTDTVLRQLADIDASAATGDLAAGLRAAQRAAAFSSVTCDAEEKSDEGERNAFEI